MDLQGLSICIEGFTNLLWWSENGDAVLVSGLRIVMEWQLQRLNLKINVSLRLQGVESQTCSCLTL